MAGDGRNTLKYVAVAAGALIVGVVGHAFYAQRPSEASGGIAVAGPVRFLSGDEGKEYLAKERAKASERDGEAVRLETARRASMVDQYAQDQELLGGAFKPISSANIEIAAKTGPSYFEMDQPFSPSYTICRLHNEDDDETYFVQVRSDGGETAQMYNMNGLTFMRLASKNGKTMPQGAIIRSAKYLVDAYPFDMWEDMGEARFVARIVPENRSRFSRNQAFDAVEAKITMFATCEPLNSKTEG